MRQPSCWDNLRVETIFKLRQSSSCDKKIETKKLRQKNWDKKNWDKKNWDKKILFDKKCFKLRQSLSRDNLRVETKKTKILRLKMWDEDESPNIETKETIKENESKIYSMRCFPPNCVYKEKIVFMN